MTQALGYAVCEEMVYDEDGRPRERDFRDYHIFAAHEMPELQTIFVETFEPSTPSGSRPWPRSRWTAWRRRWAMRCWMPAVRR